MNDDFYFGCWNGNTGHYLFDPHGRTQWNDPQRFPFRSTILDGGLLPPNEPQAEGVAALCHISGWTVISFWDRTVDKRGGCNSSFVMRGVHDFGSAVCRAKAKFPDIWNRFPFPIVQRDVC